MTHDECVAHGGHCWVDTGISVMLGDGRRRCTERCKHCPTTRSGESREPWEWTIHVLGPEPASGGAR